MSKQSVDCLLDNMTLTKIAELRKERGWTQERLAEESKVNIRTIQRLESGEDASLQTLNAVAEAFDVRVSNLFVSVYDSNKPQEIIELDNHIDQKNRKSALQLFNFISYSVFFLLMFFALSVISNFSSDEMLNIGGIAWLFICFLGVWGIKLIRVNWIEPKLDKKFPLTESLTDNHGNRSHKKVWILGAVIGVLIIIVWVAITLYYCNSF
ncbi:helix-turn-helix domain-containing protein [Secundilactobacillus kimchicus]|uniref:helix-turn-helix domain-containing protein n=1 Tax=Secundilactobacillus kimchicus TaxID=528209 RepID=UPI0024A8F531|nr:helix-turn-helix transcriptional regulator [Secundilactobacillus kimchicus]